LSVMWRPLSHVETI